jgi:ABC-type Fe3+ transport system permease subunit
MIVTIILVLLVVIAIFIQVNKLRKELRRYTINNQSYMYQPQEHLRQGRRRRRRKKPNNQ